MPSVSFRLLLVAALGLVASCGPLGSGLPIKGAIGVVRTIVSAEPQPDAAATNPRMALSRDAIEALPNDLILVEIPARQAVATLVKGATNGATTTWMSPDGISVTLNGAILQATRGLGPDLMGADTAGVRDLIAGRAQKITRRYSYLDGGDRTVILNFGCEVRSRTPEPIEIFERRYATTKVEEYCEGSGIGFTNFYWADASGTVWKSRQFVSPGIAYAMIEIL